MNDYADLRSLSLLVLTEALTGDLDGLGWAGWGPRVRWKRVQLPKIFVAELTMVYGNIVDITWYNYS